MITNEGIKRPSKLPGNKRPAHKEASPGICDLPSEPDSKWSVSLWEAGPKACRWPLADAIPIYDFRFCGAPVVDGGSWCELHCARRFARR
jgi:hypothetical protein